MRTLSFVLVLLAGCGLLIDVDPPDEDPDAGNERDAGERRDSGPDAVERDMGPNGDSDTPPFDGGGSGDAITFDAGTPVACMADDECADPADVLGPCERHACMDGVCRREFRPSGTTCDDGDPCTVGGACDAAGMCGQPRDCSERNTICGVGMCSPDSGTCTMVLTPGLACSPARNYEGTCNESGACRELACVDGFADCRGGLDDGCEVMLGTVDNCGECGDRCDRGGMGTMASCIDGECNYDCPVGQSECPSSAGTSLACVDLMADPLNCGRCENDCNGTLEMCAAGACVVMAE